MHILPAIDLRGGKCVRLRQGDYQQETIFGDDPVEMARRWASHGARWLHLVDLDGAKAGQPAHSQVVAEIVKAIGIPCELGGGLRTTESIRVVLEHCGVERAIIGTQALKQPDWFRQVVKSWPGRIALGLDARNSFVATAGWLETSQIRAFDLAKQFAGLPLAAIIYTNIANDGMMQGVDPQTISDLLEFAQLGIPVIASGGVTTLEDVKRLAVAENVGFRLHGAIVGRAIYEGSLDLSAAIRASGTN